VADGEAVRAAVDDAMDAGDVRGFQAEVAAAGAADDDNVAVEVAVLLAGVAVEQQQGGPLRVEYVVVFACHDGAPSTSGAWPLGGGDVVLDERKAGAGNLPSRVHRAAPLRRPTWDGMLNYSSRKAGDARRGELGDEPGAGS